MLEAIIAAETRLSSLLPDKRLENKPGKELLAAATKWSDVVWQAAIEAGPVEIPASQIDAAIKFNRNPVFICGTHRSGTSLLRDLLDDHPALSVLPSEGTFITNIEPWLKRADKKQHKEIVGKEWLRRLANPINQAPYWLLGRTVKSYSPYIQYARNFMAWWDILKDNHENSFWPLSAVMLSYTKPADGLIRQCYWVDKTPTNERFLQRLWREFAAAKIIHVVRDPVAILSSRKKIETWSDVGSFIRDLQYSFKVAARQVVKKDERYLLVNYESLCLQPEKITGEIADFLDIEYAPSLLRPTVAGKPSWANTSFIQPSLEGVILKPANIQRENILTKDEYNLLVASLGDSALQLGYHIAPMHTLKAFFIRLKHRISIASQP